MLASISICRLFGVGGRVQSGYRAFSLTSLKEVNLSARFRSQAFFKQKAKLDRNEIPPGGWFMLVIPVSTLFLGTWQVYRWRWKLGLMEEMRERSTADPVPLPQGIDEIEALEYRKVFVEGEFDYTKQVLIGPRSLIKYDEGDGGGRGLFSSGSQSSNGFLVITPFTLSKTKETILVNRGWISSKNPDKFNHLQGPVEITAIVRKGEQRAPFMSKNKPGQTLLLYRDVPAMAGMLGTQEIFLDLYSISGVNFSDARQQNIPIPRQTKVTLRNEHVSYFITWFSLSAITSMMWHRMFIKGLNLL